MINRYLRLALFMAACGLCSNTFAANWLYTVRPGDTLWDLCLRFTHKTQCWQDLGKVNNVLLPRRLPPGFVISFPVDWLKTVPTPVTVSFVTGEVSVKLQQDTSAVAVQVGDALPIGSKIITAQGRINLHFADGSAMQLEANSELILDTLSTYEGVGIADSRLRLNQGAVKTRVVKQTPASRFQITTPTAVAAVRGTEYRVSTAVAQQPITRGEVFTGLVDVNANNSHQDVAAGFGIIATLGQALGKPTALLPPPQFSMPITPQSLPAKIRWHEVDGAQAYQLEVLANNDNEQVLQQHQLINSNRSINALELGCYRLRLRAIDGSQLQGLAAQQQLCITQVINAPTLLTKDIHYLSRFSARLNWQPIKGASRYRVQIASDALFTAIIEDKILSETALIITDRRPRFVRIQSISAQEQTSNYSNTLQWQPKRYDWPSIITFGLIILVCL